MSGVRASCKRAYRAGHAKEHRRDAHPAKSIKTPAQMRGRFDTETDYSNLHLLPVAAAIGAIGACASALAAAAGGTLLELKAHSDGVIALDTHALAGHAFAFHAS